MTLEQMITEAVQSGAQVHCWSAHAGAQATGFQATVRGPHGAYHVVKTGSDPVELLRSALIEGERLGRDAARPTYQAPLQADIEDIIAAAKVEISDDFDGLLG